jgi:hypothetical protein
MSLPILDAAPQVAAPPAFSAPAAAEEESLEMGLEMAPLGAAPALDLDRSPPNAREGAAPQGSPERASPKAEPPMTSMSIDYERPMLDRSPSGSFRSPAAGPRPDADASRPPAYRPLQSPRASRAGQDVRERLRAPVGILLLALVVAGADTAFHRITGEGLMLGPIRPFWIAAPLALIGVGLTLWRLILEDPGDG